ncbi:MAG: zinc finger BED domain-containing protein [Catenulispora sp.]|nr:zinc finger BED domain-containing protein [Catenulispora sp.]NUT43932.1 zinc finger BED domain-containing protein [Thermoactinospora sp.]
MTADDHDAGLRHINERQPGDPRPDYSYCLHCGRLISREPDSGTWTATQLAGFDPNPQCPKAPNPDDGPMPGHQAKDVIIHPPKEQ